MILNKIYRFTQVCSFEELCFSIRVLLHSLSYSSSLLPINHPWLASSWIWIQILINPCTFRISTKQLSLSSVATRAGGGRPHRFINTQGIFRVIFESLFFLHCQLMNMKFLLKYPQYEMNCYI